MRIKEVEELVGITKKNIRFYEKEGLLTPVRESENSYRDYSEADILQLKRIKLLRRLDMPLSDIRELFDKRTALAEAIRKHSLALQEKKNSIEKALLICGMLEAEEPELSGEAVDAYLSKIDQFEREGAAFLNVKKNDVRRKYVEPIIACVVIVLLMALLVVLFSWLNSIEAAPIGLLIGIDVFLALVAIGTIAALITRIKEIRGGEENDLGNY